MAGTGKRLIGWFMWSSMAGAGSSARGARCQPASAAVSGGRRGVPANASAMRCGTSASMQGHAPFWHRRPQRRPTCTLSAAGPSAAQRSTPRPLRGTNRPSVGVPSAAARCSGPVLQATHRVGPRPAARRAASGRAGRRRRCTPAGRCAARPGGGEAFAFGRRAGEDHGPPLRTQLAGQRDFQCGTGHSRAWPIENGCSTTWPCVGRSAGSVSPPAAARRHRCSSAGVGRPARHRTAAAGAGRAAPRGAARRSGWCARGGSTSAAAPRAEAGPMRTGTASSRRRPPKKSAPRSATQRIASWPRRSKPLPRSPRRPRSTPRPASRRSPA